MPLPPSPQSSEVVSLSKVMGLATTSDDDDSDTTEEDNDSQDEAQPKPKQVKNNTASSTGRGDIRSKVTTDEPLSLFKRRTMPVFKAFGSISVAEQERLWNIEENKRMTAWARVDLGPPARPRVRSRDEDEDDLDSDCSERGAPFRRRNSQRSRK